MAQPGFWDKPSEAQEAIERLKRLKKVFDPWNQCHQSVLDLAELLGMLDENQQESLKEIETDVAKAETDVNELEFHRLLSDPLDKNSAIISINAGAGGTESCDWASMLIRMYHRWAEQHGCRVTVLDILPGEEAGIKNTTFLVEGSYAYGHLKSESGVHR